MARLSSLLVPALLGGLLVALPGSAAALEVPPLRGRVNDLAGILDSNARRGLEARLEAHERSTGQQLALLIVPSLEGDSLEGYSIRVVDAWQLGKKGRDDGLLVLVALADRAVRIEVGRGLEGQITDAHSARIIRNVVQPAFASQRFAEGLDEAFSLLMQLGGGQAAAIPEGEGGRARSADWTRLVLPLLFFFVFPMFFRLFGGRRRRGVLGGFFMGGGGRGGFGGGGGFSGGGGGFSGGGASGRW